MPIPDFAYTLELDPAKDGTWSQDESGFLYGASIRRGRDNALEPMRPGMMTLKMNNRDGRYSPHKNVITDLDQLIPVRLWSTWTTPAVTNIDDNPSAEVDATGATPVILETVVRDTTDSWVGGASFKTTAGNANNSGVEKKKRDGTRFPVTAALAYTWAPLVKCAAAKNMKIQMRWYNASAVNFQTDEAAFTFGSGWMQPVLTITAPSGAVTVALRLVTNGAQGAFDFWLDASFFYQSATLLPYVDGDQAGCSWSGTAHQSTSSRAANPTFLRFQGFIADFDIQEDKLDQTAVVTCIDRMGLWPQIHIAQPLLTAPLGSGLILHRLVDRLEGELIANGSNEWSNPAAANPATGWSVVGAGVTQFALQRGALTDAQAFEGDWALIVYTPGSAALEGTQYLINADVAATGDYVAVVYARSPTGTVAVRFRCLRDGAVVATTTVTLTTVYQRIELPFTLSSLGTNRYLQLVTDVTSSVGFYLDGLHCVKALNRIKRDFIGPSNSFASPVTAFDDPSDAIVGEVLESAPGFMFVKASTLSEGDALAFRTGFGAGGGRDAATVPRFTMGDGDGLPQFDDGASYSLSMLDRVQKVKVSSRGTPVIAGGLTGLWELAPKRALSAGDKFRGRFQQIGQQIRIGEKGGVDIKNDNQHTGLGHNIDVVTGASAAWLAVEGYPYNYPTEESSVTKEDAAWALPVRNQLTVSMPLEGTATTAMSDEAQRLLDKYKLKVVRMSLPLGAGEDEMLAFAHDVEINDLIIVRAEFESHSPNINKKFWVEGIEHQLEVGKAMETVLKLEEI